MMGTRLAIQAWAYGWPRLGSTATDHAARIALVVMAWHATDKHDDPWYGLGWRPIAEGLGIAGNGRTDHAAEAAVSRALGRLVDAGLIERTYTATDAEYKIGRQRPARWLLHLAPS